MKKSSTVAQRQNDDEAINLLSASYHCLRLEQLIKYFMITLSIGICIAAIFNRYLDALFSGVDDIAAKKEQVSVYLNLASGVVLVAGIIFGFYTSRMHTEGTVLRDRYDAYVFDNAANASILKPVSSTYISLYAKKVGKKQRFLNFIYGGQSVGDESRAQYEYIKREVNDDYKLYLYIQPFFLTLWIGFMVIIMIIAVSFNDMFVMTLINIMIPSLSAITMIGNSWYNCRLQMRELTILIGIIDKIDSLPPAEKCAYISDKKNIRLLADGLFKYRSSSFVIPNFLVKRYHKKMLKNKPLIPVSGDNVLSSERMTIITDRDGEIAASKYDGAAVHPDDAPAATGKELRSGKETRVPPVTSSRTMSVAANRDSALKPARSSGGIAGNHPVKTASKPAAKTETKSTASAPSKSETKPAASTAKAEPKPAPKAEPKPAPKVEPKPAPKAPVKGETKPAASPAKAEPKTELKTAPKPAAKAPAKVEAKPAAKADKPASKPVIKVIKKK